MDDCVNITCSNSGSCVDGIDHYSCNCKAGYTGDQCQAGKFVADILNKFKFANDLMMMVLPVARVTKYIILLEVLFHPLVVSWNRS